MKASVLTSLTVLAVTIASETADPWNPEPAVLGTDTLHGCYSSNIPFDGAVAELDFNSPGQCGQMCRRTGYAAAALQAEKCWCGDKYPANSTMVATNECNEPCPGFSPSACGSLEPKRWTVMNTGVKVSVENAAGEVVTAAESSSSSVGSTFVTESPTQSSGAAQTSAGVTTTAPAGSTPTAGAGRAVVGGVAFAAIGMGVLNLF